MCCHMHHSHCAKNKSQRKVEFQKKHTVMRNVMCSNNLFLKGKNLPLISAHRLQFSKNDKTILASFLSLRTTNMLGRFRFKLFGNFNQRLQVQKRLSFLFLPGYFCRMTEQLGGAEEGNQWPYFFRCKSLPWLL